MASAGTSVLPRVQECLASANISASQIWQAVTVLRVLANSGCMPSQCACRFLHKRIQHGPVTSYLPTLTKPLDDRDHIQCLVDPGQEDPAASVLLRWGLAEENLTTINDACQSNEGSHICLSDCFPIACSELFYIIKSYDNSHDIKSEYRPVGTSHKAELCCQLK